MNYLCARLHERTTWTAIVLLSIVIAASVWYWRISYGGAGTAIVAAYLAAVPTHLQHYWPIVRFFGRMISRIAPARESRMMMPAVPNRPILKEYFMSDLKSEFLAYAVKLAPEFLGAKFSSISSEASDAWAKYQAMSADKTFETEMEFAGSLLMLIGGLTEDLANTKAALVTAQAAVPIGGPTQEQSA